MRIAKMSFVVDLGFGDGGKGVVTSKLCMEHLEDGFKPLVVRYTGGHQAGHTVVYNGVRHVFSSFGSGTLQGVPTFFTKDTMSYLPNLWNEYNVLAPKCEKLGVKAPVSYYDPKAMVTTIYDVAFNRATEMLNRHGSCGLGISATMERNTTTQYKLHVADLGHTDWYLQKERSVAKYYDDKIMFKDAQVRDIYYEQVEKERGRMAEALQGGVVPLVVRPTPLDQLVEAQHLNSMIFEGAQGILLDQDHGIPPHTTWGYTTSRNIWSFLSDAGLVVPTDSTMYYVTRCYHTRHGNGWLPSAELDTPLINNENETNVVNEWQGSLRVRKLDIKLLMHAIRVDSNYTPRSLKGAVLAVTCLDQMPDTSTWRELKRVFKAEEAYGFLWPIGSPETTYEWLPSDIP
jgi:adenylosuccinate synthase